ncbi:DUF6257 family protein [Streptomyces fagopyri]|nr:DUF6257 family protein [Streptomyces fagopyri]
MTMAKPDDLKLSDFTLVEMARMGVLLGRMAKRGIADDGTGNVDLSDLQRRAERIEKTALRRKAKK